MVSITSPHKLSTVAILVTNATRTVLQSKRTNFLKSSLLDFSALKWFDTYITHYNYFKSRGTDLSTVETIEQKGCCMAKEVLSVDAVIMVPASKSLVMCTDVFNTMTNSDGAELAHVNKDGKSAFICPCQHFLQSTWCWTSMQYLVSEPGPSQEGERVWALSYNRVVPRTEC